MAFEKLFQILVCSRLLRTDTTGGKHLRDTLRAIEEEGFDVIETTTLEDAETAVRGDATIGCVILEWGDDTWREGARALLRTIRARGLDMPLFVQGHHEHLEDMSAETVELVTGYLFVAEDMPDFIAKNLISHLKQYAATLKTPFFGAMVDYADAGNQLWTCPGHNGGIFYWKSPVGRLFVEHLGEAVFRDDIDNSVVEMGDLLTHEGPALKAQQEAARIFGADRTYFVLNGTSTSNKLTLGALVSQDDLVLFDRNNHKSAHHGALVLAGGIPVYLPTNRNLHGLIGPIDWTALDEAGIRDAIRAHPLVTDPGVADRKRPFRIAIIEQCSYDGSIYNAEMMLEKLRPLCEYILFDEAWAGFMKFHPLFRGHYAMGLEGLSEDDPGIIATQSTHKQLAGFSQASQVHVKDAHIAGRPQRVEHRRFNEAFMLHASTSPFYPLFASLDVGAQMMKGRSGQVLWDDTVRMGIELRKRIRQLSREFEAKAERPEDQWFFDPFVPDVVRLDEGSGVSEETRWEDVPTDLLASRQEFWQLTPGAAWHGFPDIAPGYAITDPNKLTLLTPGFDRDAGAYADHGVPAPVLAQFLRENRIVPEKNDLNSILFLLTPGLEASKAGTLLSALVAFKRLHDANAPLEDVLPAFTRGRAARYCGTRLRDLCGEMHAYYRAKDTSRLQRAQFRPEHLPEIVMSPRDANQHLTRNDVDYLPISQVEGRVAATLSLVYPPGIGVVVPGERYGRRSQPMIDYLKMFEEAANLFPGFENEIQGVYRETGEDGRVRLFTYVVRE
ncbi:Orn/Lys/Arg family decarboxylase [Acidimangrovimonas sediminis]|uniref:Orn/Lys/Arg family decarboxylase n=1 Tax=Acidimangrovimonas sediminis TaxID=2056283 RepID=UPI000C80B30F|nr:Orn/Lys/Arg decarboxylase N-terminal domain-containing protein [Acidimangrovimonas sediminis]